MLQKYGQYSIKMKLAGGTLGVGVQAGLLSENFDGSKLDLDESSDPAFSSGELTGQTLDLGFGLYYNIFISRHFPYFLLISIVKILLKILLSDSKSKTLTDCFSKFKVITTSFV